MLKMKYLMLIAICVVGIVLAVVSPRQEKKNVEQPGLVPYPNSLQLSEGFFKGKEVSIINETPYSLPNTLTADLGQYFQIKNNKRSATITIIQDEELENEAYDLDITKNKIEIRAGGRNGTIYGFTTLLQLLNQYAAYGEVALPCMKIKDKPQYAWRGMHLDVCRHFFNVDEVKKMLDAMALNKLNVFHWHLTDDQGWRIEIKRYPLLTEKGAWRKETVKNHMANHPKEFDGKRYGGYYTPEQIKEVVAYADNLGIQIVPEIEMPGHAVAAAMAYPGLTCTGNPKPFNEWGVSDDVFCAGNDSTFIFLQNVIDEVVALFPSEYIHIGGDECPKDKWEKCPKCQVRIKRQGLQDEMELQSYFVKRMEHYINSKGKKVIGWDEIMEGGLAERATVMSWRGEKGGLEAASHGHDVIICPNEEVYLNFYQSNYNEPLAIAGCITMEDIYNWSPMPDSLAPEFKHHVLGSQGNIWTEYIQTDDELEYMAYPRLCALAEMLWTEDSIQNFDRFTDRMNWQYERLDRLNINYRIPYPEKILPIEALTPEHNTLDLSMPMKNAVVYYTLDGSQPKEDGIRYSGKPLVFDTERQLPIILKCATKMLNGRWSAVHTSKVNFGIMKSVNVDVEEGAIYELKEGDFSTANVDFSLDKELSIQQGIHPSDNAPNHFFAEQISGYIKVPESGIYTFTLTSSDGSMLMINGQKIIDNDGFCYERIREGRVALEEGLHSFELRHFQAKYAYSLKLRATAPNGQIINFDEENVYH